MIHTGEMLREPIPTEELKIENISFRGLDDFKHINKSPLNIPAVGEHERMIDGKGRASSEQPTGSKTGLWDQMDPSIYPQRATSICWLPAPCWSSARPPFGLRPLIANIAMDKLVHQAILLASMLKDIERPNIKILMLFCVRSFWVSASNSLISIHNECDSQTSKYCEAGSLFESGEEAIQCYVYCGVLSLRTVLLPCKKPKSMKDFIINDLVCFILVFRASKPWCKKDSGKIRYITLYN